MIYSEARKYYFVSIICCIIGFALFIASCISFLSYFGSLNISDNAMKPKYYFSNKLSTKSSLDAMKTWKYSKISDRNIILIYISTALMIPGFILLSFGFILCCFINYKYSEDSFPRNLSANSNTSIRIIRQLNTASEVSLSKSI